MEKRKTVNGEDILFAMTSLGFENYAEALKIYLSKYREVSSAFLCLSFIFWSSMHLVAGASLRGLETNKSRLNQQGERIRIGRAVHTDHREERRQGQAALIPVADPTHLHQPPIIHRLKGLTAF